MKNFNMIAQECKKKSEPCLQQCFHFLFAGTDDRRFVFKRTSSIDMNVTILAGQSTPLVTKSDHEDSESEDKPTSAYNADRVPFPRLGGSTFGPNGTFASSFNVRYDSNLSSKAYLSHLYLCVTANPYILHKYHGAMMITNVSSA